MKRVLPRLRRADVVAARAAFKEARNNHGYEEVATPIAKNEAAAVGPLGRAWYAMGEDGRDAVRFELSRMCGADAWDIDVGLAVSLIERRAKLKGGNKADLPELHPAVLILVEAWRSRGGKVQVGRRYKTPGRSQQHHDRKQMSGNPMLSFVAAGLLCAARDLYADLYPSKDRHDVALGDAHTALRALRKSGAI
ncbi:MAG: hypothetical protein AAGH70_13450 [Pseudomonadota bacterium]